MYKEVLRSIDDAGIFAVAGILIFFLFFVGLLIKMARSDKQYLNRMSALPFEEESDQNISTNSINKP